MARLAPLARFQTLAYPEGDVHSADMDVTTGEHNVIVRWHCPFVDGPEEAVDGLGLIHVVLNGAVACVHDKHGDGPAESVGPHVSAGGRRSILAPSVEGQSKEIGHPTWMHGSSRAR